MSRANDFPKHVIAKALLRCLENGKKCECYLIPGREWCGRMMRPGAMHGHHIVPEAEGGKPTLENCAMLVSECHIEVTSQETWPTIVKGRNVRISTWMADDEEKPRQKKYPPTKEYPYGRVEDRITGEIIWPK